MIKVTKLVFYFIMTIVTTQMVAQDIHFSQFYTSPLTLNPALTGNYFGDLRITGNYRTQWKSIDNKPFNTIAFGLEKQFHYYTHNYSFGAQVVSDESGYVGLQVSKFLISGAYSTNIYNHHISAGFQSGIVYKITDILRYTYDDQFDLGGDEVFNPTFTTDEIAQEPILYPILHAGFVWNYKISQRISPEIGISIFNTNNPFESFYNKEFYASKLGLKTSVYIGGKYKINNKIAICPTIIYSQEQKAVESLLGGNLEYSLTKSITPFAGTIVRYGLKNNFDASAWVFGTQYKNLRIGISYDVNISGLQSATNNRGAFEFSIIYITPSVKSTFIKIPCDRI